VRALLRTTNPKQYWLLASARLDNPQAGDPLRVIIIARSNSLSGGGLIFDTRPWLALAGGACVFSMLFWLPFVRGMTRSIGGVTAAARQIADGRFDVRVPEHRRDELGMLGTAINEMAGRLDGFVNGQKRFLGDIAHELCAPLAKLQMALGVLEQRSPAGQDTYTRSAVEKAAQIATLVNELLSFSKASFGPTAVRLKTIRVRDAVDDAVRREECSHADLRIEVPEQLTVQADRDILVRAVSNLVRNACRYAADAGPITIAAHAGREGVHISVSDCGPGVPESDLTKIFDAFYRVDTSRTRDTGGVGLGLTIVKTCVESCSGTVSAHNRPGGGLEVDLRFPVSAPASLESVR
jgi:two-component system sensor histidine kinase CpxA